VFAHAGDDGIYGFGPARDRLKIKLEGERRIEKGGEDTIIHIDDDSHSSITLHGVEIANLDAIPF